MCTLLTDAKLERSIEAPDPVYGLAVLDKKLYVLRKRQSEQIYVYDTKNYRVEQTINVDGLVPNCYGDLTECKAENCLFVSDHAAKCIRKVTPNGEVSKFVDVPYEPKGLSITPEGHLLVTCNPNKLVELNVKTGEKVCEVELKLEIYWPKHAVKRKDGQYVVSHSEKDGLSRVCRVGKDGYYRHCFGGMEGSGNDQLNCPCHVAVWEDKKENFVIVADNDNNRLVLLDEHLEYVDTLVEKFNEPHRVWFDSDSHLLYVGECTDDGSFKVFKVSK